MFEFWDWVGGRYSYDSAIGLSLMISIGPDHFRDMLAGLPHDRRALPHRADRGERADAPRAAERLVPQLPRRAVHRGAPVQPAPPTCSPPTSSSSRWRATASRSTAKDTGSSGTAAPCSGASPAPTASTRTTSCSHQGTVLVPCDFVAFSEPNRDLGTHHDLLIANCFAQTEALAFGKTPDEVRAEGVPEFQVPHRTFEGNRPTTTILAPRLTPQRAGPARRALRAPRVHRGRGVEHQLVRPVGASSWARSSRSRSSRNSAPELAPDTAPALHHDSSTNALIARYRAQRGR